MKTIVYADWLRLHIRRILIVFICAILLVGYIPDRLFAQDISSWTEGDYPELTIGESVGYPLAPANYPCHDTTFFYLSYTDENGNGSTVPRLRSRTQCMYSNNSASAGAGYIVMGSYGYVLRYGNHPANMQAVPEQHKLLWLRSSESADYGSSVSFVDNILAIGEPKPFYGSVRAHGIDIYYPTTVPTLRDSEGVEISVVAYNFSPNGEWMIAEALNLGFLRINTKTYEMQLISEENYKYGYGYLPSATLAISNDGNYAVKSGRDVGRTMMYDLTQCNPTSGFSIRAKENPGALHGCKSRSIQQSLAELTGGSVVALRSVEFLGDGLSLRGVITYYNTDGVREFHRFTYHVAGYKMPTADYLALGDSFSSGEGAYDYELGTDTDENKCHLSKNSFPYLLNSDQEFGEFHSVACSGAVIYELNNRQRDRDPPELSALGEWQPGVNELGQIGHIPDYIGSLITISIGGNDVRFADVLKSCISPGTCSFAKNETGRTEIAKRIANQYDRLVKAYKQIADKTPKKSKIYVIGYPQFIGEKHCERNTPFDSAEIELFRKSTHYLNQVAKAAADEAGVYFVDIEDALARNNLCSNSDVTDMAVNGITTGNDTVGFPHGYSMPTVMGIGYGQLGDVNLIGHESFHPNKKGHALMAEAIGRQVQNSLATFDVCSSDDDPSVVVCPRGDGRLPYPDDNYFGGTISGYVDFLNATNPIPVDIYRRPEPVLLVVEGPRPARNVHVYVQDLKPGSRVSVVSHSDPVTLGEYTVPDDGILDVTIMLPESVGPGYHTLHVYAETFVGGLVDYYQTMLVTGPDGDIDGDGIEDSVDPCGFVEASGFDDDFDGIDDACDGFIDKPIDVVAPIVTGVLRNGADLDDWHGQDMMIDWESNDSDPSSGVPSQPEPTVADKEGIHEYISEPSCDPAMNCATGSVVVKIDKTPPTIAAHDWSVSPKPIDALSFLPLSLSDEGAGVELVEYFMNGEDPGPGNATAVDLTAESPGVTLGSDIGTGYQRVTVRAKDHAGNWSDATEAYLPVYDSTGPTIRGTVVLNQMAGMGLLIEPSDHVRGILQIAARYPRLGGDTPEGSVVANLNSGKRCGWGHGLSDCTRMTLQSGSLEWLVFEGENLSDSILQGRGTLRVGKDKHDVLFRLRSSDGRRVGIFKADSTSIQIFEQTASPDTDAPIVALDISEVRFGSINIFEAPHLRALRR